MNLFKDLTICNAQIILEAIFKFKFFSFSSNFQKRFTIKIKDSSINK